jgi:multicomponent K+:H+ antiporter subunit E
MAVFGFDHRYHHPARHGHLLAVSFAWADAAVLQALVLWDILVANIRVAWIVLTVPMQAQARVVIIPRWSCASRRRYHLLAGTITLAPVRYLPSVERNGHYLLVHVLHADDPGRAGRDKKPL